jgi:hypothetical protein
MASSPVPREHPAQDACLENSVRDSLTALLFGRYPGLYRGRHLSIRENLMSFGFSHGDGWFVIIDVLSALLEARGVMAVQVKEKFGTLRFHCRRGGEWSSGAVEAAGALSGKTCEYSGHRGRQICFDGWWMTVDPDAPVELLPEAIRADLKRLGTPVRREAAEAEEENVYTRQLREAAALAAAVARDVPPGWSDLVDSLLSVLCWSAVSRQARGGAETVVRSVGQRQDGGHDGGAPVPARDGTDTVIRSVRRSPGGGLEVDAVGLDDHGQGAVAFAAAMALRIHPETGFSGPVGDDGETEWQRLS